MTSKRLHAEPCSFSTEDAQRREQRRIEKAAAKAAGKPVLPETQTIACPRIKVKERKGFPGVLFAGGAPLPAKFLEPMEHNQLLNSCCRHPENHEIEARFSDPLDCDGVPDIYIFYCECGCAHRRFCVGGNKVNYQRVVEDGKRITKAVVVEEDVRPFWTVR